MISKQDRAKQFMPFDALKGLIEKLKDIEFNNENCKNIHEMKKKVVIFLQNVQNQSGQKLQISYYKNRNFITEIGSVYIHKEDKYIIINGNKISFAKIVKIKYIL